MTNKPHETLLELVERLDKRNDGSVVGNRNIAAHYPRLSRAVREMREALEELEKEKRERCEHRFESNPGMYDTMHRYCARCGVAE